MAPEPGQRFTNEGIPITNDQAAAATRRQMQRSQESMRVDRRGWTDAQWVMDAQRLMDEPDGAITSLVNGHVDAMLRLLRGQGS